MKTKSKSFDPTTYLARDALLIREIFVLMRGKTPARSRLPSEDQDPLFQAFKIAIDSGKLPAKRFKNGDAFLNTIIYFDDLCTFVETHKNDPTWTQLYEFAERWASARGITLPVSRSAPAATAESGSVEIPASENDQSDEDGLSARETGVLQTEARYERLYRQSAEIKKENPSLTKTEVLYLLIEKNPDEDADNVRRRLNALHPTWPTLAKEN